MGVNSTQSTSSHQLAFDVSFVLGSVIAGAAVLTSIGCWCQNPSFSLFDRFDIAILCQASSVIITTLRFFHGNSIWYKLSTSDARSKSDLSPWQRIIKAFSNYYVHIVQYLLFFIVAQLLGDIASVLRWFLYISILDVIWTVIAYFNETNRLLRRAEVSWSILNIATIVLILVLRSMVKKNISGEIRFDIEYISYMLLVIYLSGAIADYLFNAELFFGIPKQPDERDGRKGTEKKEELVKGRKK